jgi:hypothetical protein
MTETIFRREAVEEHVRGRDAAGGRVRLGARWLSWTYLLTLALVLAGVAALWLVRVEETVSGPAVVDGRTGAVTALLPAAAAPDLTRSSRLTVTLPGDGGQRLHVDVQHIAPADAAEVGRSGLDPLGQPGILLTGSIARVGSAADAGSHPATARVVLGDDRLADVLGRQFGAMLGHGEAAR